MSVTKKNIINFTIELDNILLEEKHIFCQKLLDLLEKFLGIKHSILVVHRDREYLQIISNNLPKNTDEIYHSSFHETDVIANYAQTNWDRLYRDYEFILSSQIIGDDKYDESDYVKFLNKAGTHYLLCMLFDEFYLSFHKTKEMGDFTPEELDLYSDIYRLLRHKHDSFKQQKQFAYLHADENGALNYSKIGSLIFDSSHNLIRYNRFAKTYLEEFLHTFDPKNLYTDLCSLLEVQEVGDKNQFDYNAGDYYLLGRYHYQEDYYKNRNRFLSLIIMKQPTQKISPSDISKFNTLTLRETEVVQVISMGLKYQEAADELSISINTVRTHLKNIHQKLGIKNQRMLIRLFLEYQLYIRQHIDL